MAWTEPEEKLHESPTPYFDCTFSDFYYAASRAIVYILQGTLTSCSPDGKCEELHEGQAIAEGKDVTHWVENRGTRPAINLVVDISKEP